MFEIKEDKKKEVNIDITKEKNEIKEKVINHYLN